MSKIADRQEVLASGARVLAGCLLIAAFFGLDRTSNTIEVQFAPPWDYSTSGELYFWLGALTFLLPGAALVGAGLAPWLGPGLERFTQRLQRATASERLAVVLTMAVIAFAISRLGNQLVMLGQPFTDDEDAARFGGQVLATGSLWAPLPPMRHAFPELFLFQRDGHWTSFEFLGALLPWTFSELTHSGTLIFSLFAGLAPAAVAVAAMRRQGTAAGLATGALLLCSPMALTLSLTSHTHVVSRGLLALGLALVLFIDAPSFRRSLAAGAAFGLAFATRPPETTMLLLPLTLAWLFDAVRDARARPRMLGLAVGALPVIAAVFAYNVALTGSFGFLRGAANEIVTPYAGAMGGPFAFGRYWARFGNNLAYNVLTLSIWALGPLGLLLAWIGARASREHRLLGAGMICDLALTLLHDDRGLHMVGPIHLSEVIVPLALLIGCGVPLALEALEKLGARRDVALASLLGYAVLGLGIFALWHMRALNGQAQIRTYVTMLVENVPERPAVVLTDAYARMRQYAPQYERGGFVFEWRRARPDLTEPVLILRDSERARAEVERAFPQRTPYVFLPDKYGPAPIPLAELRQVRDASNAPVGP